MVRLALVACVAVIALAVRPDVAAAPEEPVRYPAVAPTFEARCASCHDARVAANAKAQAVFEMSRGYPFATQRPASLLGDLRHAIQTRNLAAADRALALRWLDGGALDAAGQPPTWR
jgi:hypothetical protein